MVFSLKSHLHNCLSLSSSVFIRIQSEGHGTCDGPANQCNMGSILHIDAFCNTQLDGRTTPLLLYCKHMRLVLFACADVYALSNTTVREYQGFFTWNSSSLGLLGRRHLGEHFVYTFLS